MAAPIQSLMSGTPVKLLDALTSTADTKGSSFALPPPKGTQGRILSWQSIPNVNPSAISLQLQGAFNDTDSEYVVLDSSTVVGGEMKTITVTNVKFIRARQVSRTGGTDITVQTLIQ